MSEEKLTVMCAECQTLIEIQDVRALVLALHLANDCTVSSLVNHEGNR